MNEKKNGLRQRSVRIIHLGYSQILSLDNALNYMLELNCIYIYNKLRAVIGIFFQDFG